MDIKEKVPSLGSGSTLGGRGGEGGERGERYVPLSFAFLSETRYTK